MQLRIPAALFVAWTVLADTAQKPIQLADILTWKRITQPVISNNGEWFAYRLGPAEGEAEVVVRNLKSGKEQRFSIGDPGASAPALDTSAPPAPPIAAAANSLAISADGRWAAFQTWPGTKDAKKLKKDRKPVQTKVVLVDLGSGKKSEFDKIRRFAFNGDRSSTLALHRYAPEVAGPPDKDKGAGSDLLLYGLADGTQMNVGNVSEFAFDKKGDWLALLIDAREKAGNGVLLRHIASGAMVPLDTAAATYKGLTWTEKGTGLATLRGVEDKAFEDKLYSVVAFKDFRPAATPTKSVFDPKADPTFPKGMTISPNRNAAWREDLAAVTFGIQMAKPKKNAPKEGAEGDAKVTVAAAGSAAAAEAGDDRPDLVLWHWKDSRLQSQQQVQENIDKNFSFLSLWRPNERKFLRLADSSVRQVNFPADSAVALGSDVREYELMGNLDGRRFEDIYVIDPATGERKLALRKARWFRGASPDGSQLLFYENGAYSTYDAATGKSTEITKGIATSFIDTESDVNVDKPPTNSLGWSKDGRFVLLSDGWDLWKVPSNGGGAVNLTGNGKKDKIRYRTRFRLDPEEKGIDFSQPQYISAYGEWTKKGGIGMLEPGKPGVRMLLWGDERYTQLLKAKDAPVYLYTRENNSASPDFYTADPSLAGGQRITDSNPQQKDYLWSSGVRVIDYTSSRGEKLQAALWLPANYDPSRKYPAIVEIYEKLSQSANQYPFPTYNGFSISAYTSNGYAVIEPDIVYKVNDPGMSAVACVVPAVKAAIATGIVDAEKVGIHGHSWGGYQTAFLVTQTDIFHAAVAGAPLTDMISMYSLLYRNTGGTNGAIFESSQGRFYGGYWDNLEAYQRNSPVYHAKNVHTPLMILHNDKDGAVDQTQGIEYFNTLRRLNKPVVMLEYKGENHGLRKPENMKDYTVRMREFFDHYLKETPAPKWLDAGVPLLEMKEHLEERAPKTGAQ